MYIKQWFVHFLKRFRHRSVKNCSTPSMTLIDRFVQNHSKRSICDRWTVWDSFGRNGNETMTIRWRKRFKNKRITVKSPKSFIFIKVLVIWVNLIFYPITLLKYIQIHLNYLEFSPVNFLRLFFQGFTKIFFSKRIQF